MAVFHVFAVGTMLCAWEFHGLVGFAVRVLCLSGENPLVSLEWWLAVSTKLHGVMRSCEPVPLRSCSCVVRPESCWRKRARFGHRPPQTKSHSRIFSFFLIFLWKVPRTETQHLTHWKLMGESTFLFQLPHDSRCKEMPSFQQGSENATANTDEKLSGVQDSETLHQRKTGST